MGTYSFTEVQLERFHKLYVTMRQCGVAFVVVAAATVAVAVLRVCMPLARHACMHALFLRPPA